MTRLLELFLKYLQVLYLDPKYRITNSTTTGSRTENASLRMTGDTTSWQLINDRGQIYVAVAPTRLDTVENWFRLTIIQQYLDGVEEHTTVLTDELAAWLSDNISRVEALFDDSIVEASCKALIALEELKATELFGPP
ncbi:hypothetical protein ABW16_18100 [Mycolicibacter heraklionensis]|uniref:Uncharacterized protein n=1 Tax=Mycolicibacter heraklionensis TaxID=512402 RepID=A0A9X7WH15_9MYCO|nr:hypothetical protein [Mycolicibacter heraklionensis]KLO26940.1 hypothetical protein ABW16_18100 [Mycolicibacter heraklionensis]QZA07329.1 hypothetical protein K3U94_20660 [Mycolicibacter heraklionensis]